MFNERIINLSNVHQVGIDEIKDQRNKRQLLKKAIKNKQIITNYLRKNILRHRVLNSLRIEYDNLASKKEKNTSTEMDSRQIQLFHFFSFKDYHEIESDLHRFFNIISSLSNLNDSKVFNENRMFLLDYSVSFLWINYKLKKYMLNLGLIILHQISQLFADKEVKEYLLNYNLRRNAVSLISILKELGKSTTIGWKRAAFSEMKDSFNKEINKDPILFLIEFSFNNLLSFFSEFSINKDLSVINEIHSSLGVEIGHYLPFIFHSDFMSILMKEQSIPYFLYAISLTEGGEEDDLKLFSVFKSGIKKLINILDSSSYSFLISSPFLSYASDYSRIILSEESESHYDSLLKSFYFVIHFCILLDTYNTHFILIHFIFNDLFIHHLYRYAIPFHLSESLSSSISSFTLTKDLDALSFINLFAISLNFNLQFNNNLNSFHYSSYTLIIEYFKRILYSLCYEKFDEILKGDLKTSLLSIVCSNAISLFNNLYYYILRERTHINAKTTSKDIFLFDPAALDIIYNNNIYSSRFVYLINNLSFVLPFHIRLLLFYLYINNYIHYNISFDDEASISSMSNLEYNLLKIIVSTGYDHSSSNNEINTNINRILRIYTPPNYSFYSENYMIRRPFLIEDGFNLFLKLDPSSMKDKIRIQFMDDFGQIEEGQDAGGLFKEFVIKFTKEIFTPQYGLFVYSNNNDYCLIPNSNVELFFPSSENSTPSASVPYSYEQLYTALGRLIGKCILENILIPSQFAFVLLKKIVNKDLFANDINDLATFDKQLYDNLLYITHYENVSDLALTFSYVSDSVGEKIVIDLLPHGRNISVTNENKYKYIHTLSHYMLNTRIFTQSKYLLGGLNSIIPLNYLHLFDVNELSSLIRFSFSLHLINDGYYSGSPNIDIVDLKLNTELHGYTFNDIPIINFFKLLESWSDEERGSFLFFVTSCSRPPLLGFSNLHPKFAIQKAGNDVMALPSASTCFNLLKLPYYASYSTLKEKLEYAVNSQSGFNLY